MYGNYVLRKSLIQIQEMRNPTEKKSSTVNDVLPWSNHSLRKIPFSLRHTRLQKWFCRITEMSVGKLLWRLPNPTLKRLFR